SGRVGMLPAGRGVVAPFVVGVGGTVKAAGVLRLVLGEQPAQHFAGALIHQVDEGEVPARVAELELREVAEAVRHLEAAAGDDDGAVALPLRACLSPGECEAPRGTGGAGPHVARPRGGTGG